MPHRNIPFLDLKKLHGSISSEIGQAIGTVLEHGQFIGGPEIAAFEKNFAKWVGPEMHAVGCGNGTDAIAIAVRALKIPKGSKAIVPAMTFVATVESLRNEGLQVELVDVDPNTCLMDLHQLEAKMSEQVGLIVPVHLYGQMCDMERVRKIADQYGSRVLEDAAQAHGAQWNGKPVGHFGDIATLSFFPGKNLGAFGDAGGIISRNEALISLCSALGKHGGLKKYEHDIVGFNSRLDTIQAAVLGVKLKYLSQWNEKRRQVAGWYREALEGVKGPILTEAHPKATHVYHLFVARAENRQGFMNFLGENGVSTGVHYPKAIHQLPAMKAEAFSKLKFPVAERFAADGVSLPMCPTFEQKDVQYICEKIQEYFQHEQVLCA